VFHQYVVQSPRRNALKRHLTDRGIGALVHYPVPVHLQPAYAGRLPAPVPLGRTECIVGRILSLPMFPQLLDEQAGRVCDAICEFMRGEGSEG
jgi:dTDP-4-amino-4,6-dideoxygalactose transaminase